jgi:hypothetical protein
MEKSSSMNAARLACICEKKKKKKKNMRWPEDKPFPKGAALFKK